MESYSREEGSQDFLGRGWKFPPQVDETTGRIRTVSYEEDIAEAIRIILFTRKGERAMRPEFGSNVVDYTFSAPSSAMMQSIAYEVRQQLLYQEPRIVNVEVACTQADPHSGAIEIAISYTVRSTNNR